MKSKPSHINYILSCILLLVRECTNPPGGFDPDTMDFSPTPPHAGTTTSVVCKFGFKPIPGSQTSPATGQNVDQALAKGQYKCSGTRTTNKVEDPSNFKVQFYYSGHSLEKCEGKLFAI